MSAIRGFVNAYASDARVRYNAHLSSEGVRRYDFKTFGYDFQDFVEQDMRAFASSFPGRDDKKAVFSITGSTQRKNTFPDVVVIDESSNEKCAVDLKCANAIKHDRGEWKPNRVPNNDLGAMDGIGDKTAEFAETYYLFVKYENTSNSGVFRVLDVTIRPFYQFVGRSKDGLLSYREKDGMMRPLPFDAQPWIRDRAHFDDLLDKTRTKRNMAIVEKMLSRLPCESLMELLDKMTSRIHQTKK